MLLVPSRTRTFGMVFLVVVAATAVGVLFAIREYTDLLFNAFRDRSIAYVQAFATSIDPWLVPVDEDMLRAASQLMMAGSALFIELEVDGQPILDEHPEGLQQSTLETIEPPLAAKADWSRHPDGSSFLDVIAPIPGASNGYVRIGIDRATGVLQARHTALLASGAALLFVLVVLGAIVWAVRRTRTADDSGPDFGSASRSATQLIAGPLAVDLDAKAVTLNGDLIALTPKQFRLLSFLVERADRVCSDQEILEGVWPNSPYADGKDVKQYVYLVRRRLTDVDPREKTRIETVPGFGYMLVSTPVDREMTDD